MKPLPAPTLSHAPGVIPVDSSSKTVVVVFVVVCAACFLIALLGRKD